MTEQATKRQRAEDGRRWKFVGAEVHYGIRYYIWRNEVTGRRHVWPVDEYRKETRTMTLIEAIANVFAPVRNQTKHQFALAGPSKGGRA